jgi:hypothetical protein
MSPSTKHNVNIAITQGGDYMRLGDRDNIPTNHYYDDMRAAFSNAGSPNYVGFYDPFLGDLLDAKWVPDLSAGSAITLNGDTAEGIAVITTDTDDDDHATLALGLHWLVSNGLTIFEAKLHCVTAITVRGVEIGLSDAISETNGLAFSDAATPTAVADDAAVFVINSDDSVTAWNCLSVNGGGTEQLTESGVTAVAGAYNVFRIEVEATGEARFYIDGVLVATHALALATTALMTPWISVKTLSSAIITNNLAYVNIMGPAA